MEEETLTRIVYACCAIAGTLARGFVCGIFPAAVSLKRGNTKYAKRSLIISMGFSFISNLFASVIVSFILLAVILKEVPAPSREVVEDDIKKRLGYS